MSVSGRITEDLGEHSCMLEFKDANGVYISSYVYDHDTHQVTAPERTQDTVFSEDNLRYALKFQITFINRVLTQFPPPHDTTASNFDKIVLDYKNDLLKLHYKFNGFNYEANWDRNTRLITFEPRDEFVMSWNQFLLFIQSYVFFYNCIRNLNQRQLSPPLFLQMADMLLNV